jgi:hypothetical protein
MQQVPSASLPLQIANVKTTMQTKLQKALIRTPSQELAQQGNGCRSMAPHVAQRGSSTTSKGLFGQVVQQQQATGRRVGVDMFKGQPASIP